MKPNMVLTVTLSIAALLALTPAASAVTGPSGTAGTAVMAEKGAAAVRLDTSTRASFDASFTKLKASLSADDRLRLNSALAKLVAPYIEPAAAGKSATDDSRTAKASPAFEDILYEKLGTRLDGASFEDILALAG